MIESALRRAHDFENALVGDIVCDVYEIQYEHLFDAHADVFERSKNYGLPDGIANGADFAELGRELSAAGLRAYGIHASYGSTGFILARSHASRVRAERWRS